MLLWRIDPLIGKGLETNDETTAVAMQRRGKDASKTRELLLEIVFSLWSVQRSYLEENWSDPVGHPCGGGVEYLHRDPASRRRRRKGKSQI
jgi:hypothetical protein